MRGQHWVNSILRAGRAKLRVASSAAQHQGSSRGITRLKCLTAVKPSACKGSAVTIGSHIFTLGMVKSHLTIRGQKACEAQKAASSCQDS